MVAGQLAAQQPEQRLWSAANSLRGPVDPADFKAYAFPFLSLKWMSDTCTWEHADAVADLGPDVLPEEKADYNADEDRETMKSPNEKLSDRDASVVRPGCLRSLAVAVAVWNVLLAARVVVAMVRGDWVLASVGLVVLVVGGGTVAAAWMAASR